MDLRAWRLASAGALEEAEAFLRQAQRRYPGDFWINQGLGNLLTWRKQRGKQGLEEAIGYYRAAVAIRPDNSGAHNDLGVALHEQGKLDEAVQAFGKAIALQPDLALPYSNLGNALRAQRKLDEAVQALRKAIALRPDLAEAHNNLGNALRAQRKLDEAVRALRKAIALQPEVAGVHQNLGLALHEQGKLDEAVQAFRKGIALQPDYAEAHYNLGLALRAQGKPDGAVQALRKAIALQPDYAEAHYNLGLALHEQRKLDEAVQAYRKAVALRPDLAEAHCNLGKAQLAHAELADGLASLKRGHRLGCQRAGWPYPSAQWVQNAERLVRLNARLPEVLAGRTKPRNNAQRLALADLCQKRAKQFYAAAVRLYSEAFAAQPSLAIGGLRYNAACAAALAGCGKGKDAPQSEKERAHLRGKALAWLRADLSARQDVLQKLPQLARPPVAQLLRHWQKDLALAGVRDAAALAKLPETECRKWIKLWGDVSALLAKASPEKLRARPRTATAVRSELAECSPGSEQYAMEAANPYPTLDESLSRLRRAGWSVGDTGTASGWQINGTNGENGILGRGASQAEPWHRAVDQAEAVGMAERALNLRMALLVSAILAVAGSGLSAGETELTQYQVIARIQKVGGRAHVLENQLGKPVAGAWSLSRFTDRDVPLLRGLATLIVLDLSGSRVTDKGLVRLKNLTSLEHLELRDTPVTDKGLRTLKRLTALRLLDLTNTKVTAAGVRELQKALAEVEVGR
jgi:tetratricopeptide (TPR) repeat protein